MAVMAARAALPAWRALAASERGKLLSELGRRVEENAEEIARVLAAESGNAIKTQSRGEAMGASGVLKYYGGVAVEQKGETLPLGPGLFSYSTREPHGVVGSIIPWNSPLQLGSVKISMALATGNCLVLKPAEDAPLAILKLAELLTGSSRPACSTSSPASATRPARRWLATAAIDKVSFTGSSEVGRLIGHATADRIAKLTLELGGKSPTIVFLTPLKAGGWKPRRSRSPMPCGSADRVRAARPDRGSSCTVTSGMS